MILVDTSILIEILRKNSKVLSKLAALSLTALTTSEICVMELIYGIFRSRNYQNRPDIITRRLQEFEQLCSKFVVLPFDRKCSFRTGEVMGKLKIAGNMIDFRDGMIAGTALANGVTEIYTADVAHFQKIPELKPV